MKKNKKPLLVLTLPLLASSLLSGCSSLNSLVSIILDAASEAQCSIYGPTSEGENIVSSEFGSLYYVKYDNLPEVPYLSFDTALEIISSLFGYGDNLSNFTNLYSINTLTFNNFNSTLSINTEENTITFTDYDRFIYDITGGATTSIGVYNPIVSASRSNYIELYQTNISIGNEITFDLSKYGIDITYRYGSVCLPLQVLSDIFFAPLGYPLVFNGKDIYVANYAVLSYDSFAESYYKSDYLGKELSENFANFNYALTCFEIDYFYGYPTESEQHTYSSLDEYLQKNNPRLRQNLKSTDGETNASAFANLLLNELGDGHTGYYKNYGSFYARKFNGATSASKRLLKMSSDYEELNKLNEQGDRTSDGLYTYGDTTIIKFSSFDSVDQKLTTNNIARYANEDTFALFYQAFKKINNMNNISNVVFDLTLNEGGYINTLVAVLGFLMPEVPIHLENPLTGAKAEQIYRVDTDLDGLFDDFTGFASFNYYVLTSNYSFSCGNAFPAIFKNMDIGKVIGEQSGGGACAVYSNITSAGQPYQMSGLSRISLKSEYGGYYESVDKGVSPDISLSRDSFYKNASLVAALK